MFSRFERTRGDKNQIFRTIDVIDVDESQQTVTLLMKVRMAWNDDRIDVKRSQSDKDKYVEFTILCYSQFKFGLKI